MIFQFSMEPASQYILGALSSSILKIIFAILIFLFGFILGKIVGRVVYKLLEEIEINEFLKKTTGLRVNAEQIISNFLAYSIYFLALVAALEQIGVANIILYFLSAAIILIILISFFLAIRDFLPNFLAGIYMYSNESLKKGSRIEIDSIKGEITHVDLLHVKIKTKKGDIIYIPNSVVAKSKITVKN